MEYNNKLLKAIYRTLTYSDIFDYPLTPRELYQFLITDEALSYSLFRKVLIRINTNRKYYFLKGKDRIVSLRKKREIFSQKKLEIARKVAERLKLIPTIKLVGITGALAMGNSEENDDIDFMVITSKNRLWITRFLALLLIEVLGKRRRPDNHNVKDKICPNIFLDENHLEVTAGERNLFTAHETCQMKVLWEKDNAYEKFLGKNSWVKEYLPNAVLIENLKFKKEKVKVKFKNYFFDFLERIAFKIQLAYMKPKMTTEEVSEGAAFFHPEDCSGGVLRKYNEKLKELGID